MSFDNLEFAIGIIALVVLLLAQLWFLSSRLNVRRNRGVKTVARKKAAAPSSSKAETPTPPVASANGTRIDPNLFSRFQENLQQSDDTRHHGPSEPNSDVILSISSQAKPSKQPELRKYQKRSLPKSRSSVNQPIESAMEDKTAAMAAKKRVDGTVLSRPVPVENIDRLFDDVLDPIEEAPSAQNRIKPARKTTPRSAIESEFNEPPVATSVSVGPPPLVSHEVLTSEDLIPDHNELPDEGEFIVSVARQHFEKGDYSACLSAVRQFLDDPLNIKMAPSLKRKLIQLQGESEFNLNMPEKAAKTWQSLFRGLVQREDDGFLNLLEDLIDKFIRKNLQQHAVHFLFTALNEYRQAQDFQKMDQIYEEIETAYEQTEDWGRLIQTYQNHLTIKKTLKDLDGQLELLDHLGKLLYDQGDAEGSKKCYEQRLIIENNLSRR
jgi:tetratricopeptide (TPR) repeat protein